MLLGELDGQAQLSCTGFGASEALTSSDHNAVAATFALRAAAAAAEAEPLHHCSLRIALLDTGPLQVAGTRNQDAGVEGGGAALQALVPALTTALTTAAPTALSTALILH